MCPLRQCGRFERRSHSAHESSHFQINNVCRRTKILPPIVSSRASVQRERTISVTSGKIGSDPSVPMAGISVGLAEYEMTIVTTTIIINKTTPTSDCSDSRRSHVFTRYVESQKALQLNNIALSLPPTCSFSASLILLTFFSLLSRRAYVCASHRALVHSTLAFKMSERRGERVRRTRRGRRSKIPSCGVQG